MVTLRERPTRIVFALLMHAVLAAMSGIVGAIYAVHVHASQDDG